MGNSNRWTIRTITVDKSRHLACFFCDLPFWKCAKRHKLHVESLVLSVPFCCKNVKCVRNSGVSSKIRRRVKWASNSGSFCENQESWQPWLLQVLAMEHYLHVRLTQASIVSKWLHGSSLLLTHSLANLSYSIFKYNYKGTSLRNCFSNSGLRKYGHNMSTVDKCDKKLQLSVCYGEHVATVNVAYYCRQSTFTCWSYSSSSFVYSMMSDHQSLHRSVSISWDMYQSDLIFATCVQHLKYISAAYSTSA